MEISMLMLPDSSRVNGKKGNELHFTGHTVNGGGRLGVSPAARGTSSNQARTFH